MNTYEYQAELEKIARRRAISDAMLQESFKPMSGTEMAGSGNVQMAVPKSPFEALSHAVEPMMGAYQSRLLDDKALALKKQQGDDMTKAIQDYQDQVRGGMDDSVAAVGLLGKVADPSQAATLIATNALKPGKYGDVKFNKEGRGYRVDVENPNKIWWMDPSITPPAPKPVTGTIGVEGDPEARQTAVIDPGTNKATPVGPSYRPKSQVQLSVGDKGETAVLRSLAEGDVSSLKKEEEELRNGAINIATMEAAKQHIPKAITGAFPDARLNFARGLEMIFPDLEISDKIINSQDFDAKMGDILLQNIRKLAPVTNEDVGILKGIIGSRANNPNALVDILTFAQNKIANQIKGYNVRNRQLRGTATQAMPSYGYTGEIEIPDYNSSSTYDQLQAELKKRGLIK